MYVHLLPWRRRKFKFRFLQKFAVNIGENTARPAAFRNNSVIDAGKKQRPYFTHTRALNIPDNHFIHVLRYGPDLDFGKARVENIRKFFHRQFLIAKQRTNLLQKLHDKPVNLFIFLRPDKIVFRLKHCGILRQLLRNLRLLNKCI